MGIQLITILVIVIIVTMITIIMAIIRDTIIILHHMFPRIIIPMKDIIITTLIMAITRIIIAIIILGIIITIIISRIITTAIHTILIMVMEVAIILMHLLGTVSFHIRVIIHLVMDIIAIAKRNIRINIRKFPASQREAGNLFSLLAEASRLFEFRC